VWDEGLRVVNHLMPHLSVLMERREKKRVCYEARKVRQDEAPANYVPAAAVIRRAQALSGFTGRKECVGVSLHLVLNLKA